MRLIPRLLLTALTATLIFTACADEPTAPTGGPAADTSFYLVMSDDVRIAVDVHLPAFVHDSGGPTIMELTRYWRDRGTGLPAHVRRARQRGYAYVIIDERGTGASFGTWTAALTDRALADAGEVMDWIVDQPWSDGHIVATGISYPGMAAQQMSALGHPALKAVAPRSAIWDLYPDLLFPGGLRNEYFIHEWSAITSGLDHGTTFSYAGATWNLQPVDDDPDGTLLRQAVAEHTQNAVLEDLVADVEYRDDPLSNGLTLDSMSSRFRGVPAGSVAVYLVGSWLDGATADGVIRQFKNNDSIPTQAIIGGWSHNLEKSASPFQPAGIDAHPDFVTAWNDVLDYFDLVLDPPSYPPLDSYGQFRVLGLGAWFNSPTWPPSQNSPAFRYLDADGTLATDAPATSSAYDSYTVDFTATSGPDSRWHGPITGVERYPDRAAEDEKLLVYETPAVTEETLIVGYPWARLFISSTHEDGAVIMYLEDVAPDGVVRYLTEGELRLIHRATPQLPAGPWYPPIPPHSYRSEDAAPVVPGEVTEVLLALQPIAARIEPGHRIRIAIAGADADTFQRVPATGTPTLQVYRDATYASFVSIPFYTIPD